MDLIEVRIPVPEKYYDNVDAIFDLILLIKEPISKSELITLLESIIKDCDHSEQDETDRKTQMRNTSIGDWTDALFSVRNATDWSASKMNCSRYDGVSTMVSLPNGSTRKHHICWSPNKLH